MFRSPKAIKESTLERMKFIVLLEGRGHGASKNVE